MDGDIISKALGISSAIILVVDHASQSDKPIGIREAMHLHGQTSVIDFHVVETMPMFNGIAKGSAAFFILLFRFPATIQKWEEEHNYG
ncbi:hypothetical protein GCM10011511_11630 [Puia dinghuensis]|uniref:Uncharacterized protein n=1 Tax=Puia dinghuensis TaxID=1792502 RepID=A0A8J2UA46_9BACT|nr:hypothetical protein GCM10011511_11630 [Puia dinghuensis]